MRITGQSTRKPFNTMTLAGVSLLWGQMLGYLHPYFTPLTVLCILIGYGSEHIKQEDV
tara:strand:+ start:814 stop:987 length:174 start_codon:yes stop_codon:yes gene_type:complete